MPASRRPITYGPEYEQALIKAATSAEGFVIAFGSAKTARSMQARFYAYFRALRSAGERPDLITMADKVALRTTDDGNLCFLPAADRWDRAMLRNAMGLEKGFEHQGGENVTSPPSSTEALRAQLAEMRAAGEKKPK